MNPALLERAFRRAVAAAEPKPVPHQSRKARFPGSSLAAAELGVSRGHLHAVLSSARASASLAARWKAWLQRNPEFAGLQRRQP